MHTAHAVDHGDLTDLDVTLGCRCGRSYRVFPLALPAAYAAEVTATPHGWTLTGPTIPLEATVDDGTVLYVETSWTCPCGLRHSYRTPTYDTVECTFCPKAALRRRPPADYYTNPRYGQACSCCGQDGTHRVRRDQAATFTCRSSW